MDSLVLDPEALSRGLLKHEWTTGVLLYGPSEANKLDLCRALANEYALRMLVVEPRDVTSSWAMASAFSLARRLAPCILFFKQAHNMFSSQSPANGYPSNMVGGSAPVVNVQPEDLINNFLVEPRQSGNAGTTPDGRIMVICSTNRPQEMKSSVLRKFPHRINVELPGLVERGDILKVLLEGEITPEGMDVSHVAGKTERFSASDLRHLVVSAAIFAAQENPRVLQVEHFESALVDVGPSTMKSEVTQIREWADEFVEGAVE